MAQINKPEQGKSTTNNNPSNMGSGSDTLRRPLSEVKDYASQGTNSMNSENLGSGIGASGSNTASSPSRTDFSDSSSHSPSHTDDRMNEYRERITEYADRGREKFNEFSQRFRDQEFDQYFQTATKWMKENRTMTMALGFGVVGLLGFFIGRSSSRSDSSYDHLS